MSTTLPFELELLGQIALKAGTVVMQHYQTGSPVRTKSDLSPVTDADEQAERLILEALARHYPDVPVAAEEQAASGKLAPPKERFFLVDPLDGTKEFLKANGEFTVNIAEIVDHIPVRGVVYAPAKGRLFLGSSGLGAFEVSPEGGELRRLSARKPPDDGLVVLTSRSHRNPKIDEFLSQIVVKEVKILGSSLKFCLIAAGEGDIYPRLGPTMEWDTAAGHAVLAAAGGRVGCWDGTPLLYGKPDYCNPPFIARGR